MQPRIHLVTLGVAEVAAAAAFYERLGLRRSAQSNDQVVFFPLGPVVLGLFGRAALAADATMPDGPVGFSGVTLAFNQPDRAAVDAVMAEAEAAGARIVKPAHEVFWGGYSGYFADPDGHLWEVAHNPFWSFDEAGSVRLPD